MPADTGVHSIEVIKTSEKEEIPADIYVRSFHHNKYWTAHPVENRIEFSPDSRRSTDYT